MPQFPLLSQSHMYQAFDLRVAHPYQSTVPQFNSDPGVTEDDEEWSAGHRDGCRWAALYQSLANNMTTVFAGHPTGCIAYT